MKRALFTLALLAAAATPALADQNLATTKNCMACHTMDKKLVGPSFVEIARRHAGKTDYLVGKIRSGGTGVWGGIPMPPQTLPDADLRQIATWLASGASK